MHPSNPISDDVLSPTKIRNLAGSQLRNMAVKEPGGRIPGNGKYGLVSFTSVEVLALASRESMRWDCSTSGAKGPWGM